MSGDGLSGGQHQHGEHRTPRDTERLSYDRLRSAGVDRETARKQSRIVSREVHERK